MFTHEVEVSHLSKVNDRQINIIHECLFMLATKSGENDNNFHSYALPTTCNFQIVSFLTIYLLLQFLDCFYNFSISCAFVVVFSFFAIDFTFQFLSSLVRHYLTFATSIFFVNTICAM